MHVILSCCRRAGVPGNCSFLQERDSIHYLEDFACGPLATFWLLRSIILGQKYNKNQLNPKRVWDRESKAKMPMDSTVDFSAFYRDETGFGQETTGREARTRTGKFARKASRSIKQEILISFIWTGSTSGEFWFLKQEKLFGNPIRRTESGRLCYVSRSDLYNVDTDTETDVDRAWLRNTLLRHDFYYVIRRFLIYGMC